MRVIGTAGHVDHGKSTLILALTGIDPDRLPEEKAREMTIDLGFAWLTLPGGEQVGVVDVPGHIDFIKNMLAGIGGIDAVLFVVAADEGPMPQTREHLSILDLLEVPAGVVALTKTDLVREPEWLELVQEEVRDLLENTSLRHAPIVPVSARHGSGLQELLAALESSLQEAPTRPDRGRPRLPIDRVFTVAGFGTVVTGTLSGGDLELGQEVEVVPGGQRARIRGLQSHKQKIDLASPGSRVAVNLSGVSSEELQRGQVLSLPGQLKPSRLLDVRVRMLRDAPGPLKHNQQVDFFSGAAEVLARTRLLDAEALPPGEEGWVQLRLRQLMAVTAGDRFILRLPSPSRTLGGGVIVDPYPERRHKRFRPDAIARLEALARGRPTDVLLHALQSQEPAVAREVLQATGLESDAARKALDELLDSGQVFPLDISQTGLTGAGAAQGTIYLVSESGWSGLCSRLQTVLTNYHEQNPLRTGMPREELRSRLQPRGQWPGRLFNELVGRAEAEDVVAELDGLVRLPSHEVRFSAQQQRRLDELLVRFRSQPYGPPTVTEASDAVGEDVLQALIDLSTLVRVSEEILFERDVYEQMVERIVSYLRAHGSITVAALRDLFGTSRKYVLPLLEHLDEVRVTRRQGDERVLR